MSKILLLPQIQNGQVLFSSVCPQLSLWADSLLAGCVRNTKACPMHSACFPQGSAVDSSKLSPTGTLREEVRCQYKVCQEARGDITAEAGAVPIRTIRRPMGRKDRNSGLGLQEAAEDWDPFSPRQPLGVKEREHTWSVHAHLGRWGGTASPQLERVRKQCV